MSGLDASAGIEVKVHCRSDRTQNLWTTICQADEGTSESLGHPQNMRGATSATFFTASPRNHQGTRHIPQISSMNDRCCRSVRSIALLRHSE